MPEDNNNALDADSTNPLPLEQFIRQHIAMLIKQGDEVREQMSELREQMSELREQQVKLQEQQIMLREEMIGRFEQLSQQNLRLEALSLKIREEIRDLDYKVGPFIKEQINLKRSLDEVRERVGLETY